MEISRGKVGALVVAGSLAWLTLAGHKLPTWRSSPEKTCAANLKALAAAIQMYDLDCSIVVTKVTHPLLVDLVSGGYLERMPEDPGGGLAWECYYIDGEVGSCSVACRVHGALLGSDRRQTSGQSARPAPVRGFDADREASSFRLHRPLGEIALGGPVTAAALGLPHDTSVVSVATLIEKTRHRSARTRAVAALALRRSRDPKVVPTLAGLLSDPDAAVRKQAVWGLGYLADQSHDPALKRLLTDPAETVAAAAAMALARHCEPEGVERCFRILGDSHQLAVRRAEAARALRNLACVGGQGTVAGDACFYRTASLSPAHPDRVRSLDQSFEVSERLTTALQQSLVGCQDSALARACQELLEELKRSAELGRGSPAYRSYLERKAPKQD